MNLLFEGGDCYCVCPLCNEVTFEISSGFQGFFDCLNGCEFFIFKHSIYQDVFPEDCGELILIKCSTFYYFGL